MMVVMGPQTSQLRDRYILLELDTVSDGQCEHTAWCVIDDVPSDQLQQVPDWLNWHDQLMINYRARNWLYCAELLARLKGSWNSQVDSFYDTMWQRVQDLINCPPGSDWTSLVFKYRDHVQTAAALDQ